MAGPDECPWERHWDDESSSYYYFNPSTESSEWDVPAGWEAHFAAIDAQEGSTTADNAAVPGADDGNAGDEDGKEDYPVTGESTEERAAHSPAYAVGQENAGDPMEQDDDNEDKPLETTDGAVGEAERGEDSMLEETQEEGEASYPEQSYDIGGDDQGADQDGDQAEQGGDQDEAMDEEGREAGEEDVSRRSHDSSAEDGAVEDGALEDGAAEGDGVQEYGDEAENDEVVAEAAVDDYYIATGGSTSPALDGASTCAWIQTEDDTGNVFYYNELTEESSWDAPPEFTAYQATLQQEQEEGQQEVDEDNTSPYAAADGEGDDRDSGFVDEESPPLSMSPPPPLPQIYYPAGTPSPPSSPEEDNEGEEELTPAEGEEELTPADVAASASSTSSSSKASPRPGDTPEAAGGGQRAGMPIIGAHAARSTRRYAKSPSPDLATGGTGVAGGGGMSFPSFGEDSSPKYDWHGEDEGSPPLMPGSAAGSSSFGGSPSPDTMNGSGVGFASGELSPILDNSGSVGVVLDGEQAVGTGPTAGGKENELARAGGGIRVSEAISREQRTESAEEDVADSERRLEEKDAIMEVDFHARVTEYQSALRRLRLLKGEQPNNKESLNLSVKKLIAGYQGYAQQAALVNNWLHLGTDGQEDTESMMLQQLTKLIKKNFDAKKADALLDSGSGVPSWLTAMQGDDGWRRTLIELAREHRGSALLRFVLKQLSDRGHHREIAAVISETDLFSVFNGVLKDALARIPADDEVEILEALADLKRMCCSTSYMFMYSQQLLIDLERAAQEMLTPAGGDSGDDSRAAKKLRTGKAEVDGSKEADERRRRGQKAAAKKYKRLRQELAKHMYEVGGADNYSFANGSSGGNTTAYGRTNSGGGGGGGGSGSGSSGGRNGRGTGIASGRPTGAFVRRVEQGLSLGVPDRNPSANASSGYPPPASAVASARAASEAVMSLLGQAGGGVGAGGATGGRRTVVLHDAVETLISAFGLDGVRRAATEGAATQVQNPSNGHTRPPASLIRHDTAIDILLEALFHPAHRSQSEELRAGCCALLAYASCVEVPILVDVGVSAGEAGDKERKLGDPEGTVDFGDVATTSHALMQSSEECFDMRPSQLGSLQGRLRPFAEHPTVSLGALKWIHAQVSNEAFCATPSFLSYAPVFLKLCGQAADDHPPQRPEAFEILTMMLSAKTPADTPPSAKTKLKQQVLLRMADLMVKGYVLPVLAYLRRLAEGQGLDQHLYGFFIVKIVGVAVPRGGVAKTYSPAFINAMADLMGVPRVRQALQGNQLSPKDRERLNSYARYCLRFQSKDLTDQALESIKQLQSGLERA